MIVRPGLVYPSGKPAPITDYDCEAGSLLTRELNWKSRSGCLSVSSRPFSNVTVALQERYNCVTITKNRLQTVENGV